MKRRVAEDAEEDCPRNSVISASLRFKCLPIKLEPIDQPTDAIHSMDLLQVDQQRAGDAALALETEVCRMQSRFFVTQRSGRDRKASFEFALSKPLDDPGRNRCDGSAP
jgi:hypothetical protein